MIIGVGGLVDLRHNNSDETIAYCGGVFDLLHEGHLDVLSRLHDFGKIAVVGVASDERVKFRKGSNRPIHNEHTRLSVVDALKHVDYSFLYPGNVEGYEIIGHYVLGQLKPDFFITSDEVWEEDRSWLADQGTTLEIIPRYSDEISTTQTIEKILQTNTP
ncbi:MAG TPA: adenylyltransferase/cytidyltransferase family protein [Candidatus Saccharimonadales bacterium]|nr:adenylyltransferase/cytidyltransferase family protein [Candidatus Saccharimonadales bacterium]